MIALLSFCLDRWIRRAAELRLAGSYLRTFRRKLIIFLPFPPLLPLARFLAALLLLSHSQLSTVASVCTAKTLYRF